MSIAEAHAKLTAPGARFETEELTIRGVRGLVWKNAPPTLRHVLLTGRAFKDRTFLVYEDDRATYEAFTRAVLTLVIRRKDGVAVNVPVICRLDTAEEVEVYEAGGVLQRFAQDFLAQNKAA